MNESEIKLVDVPVVAPESNLAEITVKALLLGLILSGLLAAANAYIGLLVGLTVSASIPAAALSMGVLRFFRRSNILENNMVQTAASAGESLVAGIIFTIPALVIMGAWTEYNYWALVSIAVVGGIMGVAFTIPLRRALIVEAKLKYPEGVATAEVLKSGGIETNKDLPHDQINHEANAISAGNIKRLMQASGIGALFKLLESGFGWLAGGISTSKAWLGGSYLFSGGITLSPALLGVGYIVGLNISILIFLGGAIGTLIGVPLNWILNSDTIMSTVGIDPATSWQQLSNEQWQTLASESWQNCRRIGVGAMMVGGLWSLISLFKPLIDGVKASLAVYKSSKQKDGPALLRTEFDTPFNIVITVALLGLIPVFFIFYSAMGDYPDKIFISGVMTLLMLLFGFIFSSVAGYMAGLVGSSNNPISGVTIATVITSALILLQLMGNEGMAATLGPIAVIFLAGLICSAAAIAGDNMQDLKCGHIIGATPWRQQLFQVVGVLGAAMVIPLVLHVLDAGYGIGRPSPGSDSTTFLSAPQAGLMRELATGIFGAGIKWNYIFVGFGLAFILIVLDEIQKKRGSDFRFPVLAVAVGVYLPLGLSVPIFIGGLLAHRIKIKSQEQGESVTKQRESRGLLLASGLITGEALMGVLIAVIAAFVMQLPAFFAEPFIASILGFVGLIAVIYYLQRSTMKL